MVLSAARNDDRTKYLYLFDNSNNKRKNYAVCLYHNNKLISRYNTNDYLLAQKKYEFMGNDLQKGM